MKETLKNLREKNNLSQAAVAEYLGISRGMYIKYEAGENEPTLRGLVQLAKLYKVDYADIIENKCSNLYATKKSEQNLMLSNPTPAYGIQVTSSELYLKKLEKLSYEQKKIITDLIDTLSKSQKKENTGRLVYGLAKGKFQIPEDINLYDDEILESFGGDL